MPKEQLKAKGATAEGKEPDKTGKGVTSGESGQVVDRAKVLTILGPIYKEEQIVTQSIRCLDGGKYESTFIFPKYEKTRSGLGHVSANQISEAIIEAIDTTLALEIERNQFPLAVPYNWFNSVAMNLILFRTTITYRRELYAGDPALLSTSISSVGERKLRRRFLSVVCNFAGMISGEAETLLSFDYIPQNFS